MANLIDRVKDSLKVEESERTQARFRGMERFFSDRIGNGRVSWGLVLLGAFAVYAVVNLLIVLFGLFG